MKTNWQEYYELGKRAFQEKDYSTALKHMEQVAGEKDTFADVFNMLGMMYFDAGRHEDAILSFKKAVKINPRYTEASLNLSVVYNEIGAYTKAQEAYAAAKESGGKDRTDYLDPFVKGKLANMHAELGTIYKDLGHYSEAIDEYKKALELGPNFEDIKTNLGVVYRDMKDYSRAVKILEEAVNLNPGYAPARIQLGLTYYTMGQAGRAKAEWLKVVRKDPNDKLANMYLNLLKSGRTASSPSE